MPFIKTTDAVNLFDNDWGQGRPVILIHGAADETVPIDSSARVAARLIRGAHLIEYHGEPHGLHATAKTRLHQDLLAFIRQSEATTPSLPHKHR